MSRVINKLVQASGGWEKFLYQILKDLLVEVDPTNAGTELQLAYDEAKEVLEAYEEVDEEDMKDKWIEQTKHPHQQYEPPIHIPSSQVQPVVEGGSKVVEAHKPALVPESPKPKPIRQVRNLTARVHVDAEIGSSQGDLPIPAGYSLHNRDHMTVETQGRAELGRGSSDGQVRGPGASGYISLNGKYKLVFTDTNLGSGIVHFTVIQDKKKEVEKKDIQEKQEELS